MDSNKLIQFFSICTIIFYMLEKYELHLNKITDEITSYFDEQKDYLKCKQGCSLCCSNSYYPVSELEYAYLKKGLESFSKEDIESLQTNALEIYKQRKEFLKTNPDVKAFSYVCPFLKNDLCTVYKHRPLVCRTHGLIANEMYEGQIRKYLPYCVNEGLNYSEVYNLEEKTFSYEKLKALGSKNPPNSYDISCSALMKTFEGAEFGDVRMIFEWIILDIPDYQNIIKSL